MSEVGDDAIAVARGEPVLKKKKKKTKEEEEEEAYERDRQIREELAASGKGMHLITETV